MPLIGQFPSGRWTKPNAELESTTEFLARWIQETADMLKEENDRLDRADPPACSHCQATKLAECECDPTPWCSACGAKTKERCDCGPIADNN